MKLLASSDWQCSASNLPKCETVVDHILELIPNHQIKAVLLLGDMKHALSPVDLRVMNFLSNAVQRIVARCPTYVLLGNHDKANLQDSSESCLPLLQAAGATVFEEPEAYDLGEGLDIYGVPFMRDKEKLRKALQWKPRRGFSKKILLFHEEVTGSLLNVKTKSTSGITLEDLQPDKYDLCLGGHLHMFQKIHSNTYYVGSPFVQDWGECNQLKGFLLVDTKDFKVTQIPSRVPGWYDPDFPNFTKKKEWEGSQIRIHPSGTPTEISQAKLTAEKKYPGAIIHIAQAKDEIEIASETPLGETDVELLQHYLEQTVAKDQIGPMLDYLQTRVQGSFSLGLKGFRFVRAFAKEYLSFKEVELDLTKPGLTLVTGANGDWPGRGNGAGKSNYLSIPQAALFGTTLKGQSHDELRRNGSAGPTTLMLQGVSPNGEHVQIDRGRKPGFLRLSIEGKDRTMGDANATQKLIEEITGLTEEVFTNSIYIGQAEVSTLLYGTDKQKKELFSRFMGLERFIKAQDAVRKDIRACNDRIAEVRNEADIAQSMGQESRRSLVKVEPPADPFKYPDKDRLVSIISKDGRAGTFLQRKLEDEIEAMQPWFEANQQSFERYLDSTLKAEAKIEQLQGFLDKMDEQPDSCPLCGSKMKGADRERHENEMKAEIEALEEVYAEAEKKKNQNREARSKKQEELHSKRIALEKEKKAVQQAEIQQKLYEQALATYSVQQEQYKTAERRIKLLELRATIHKNYVAQLEKHLVFLQDCLRVVSREGLPTYLCARVCPRLNSIARKYSNLFTDGEINVEFHIEEGDLNLEVRNLHGGAGVYDQSQGELRLAGIISVFAFKQALISTPLLVLDEPGEGLDAYNSNVFARGLREAANTFGSVFLTTHSANIISALEPDYHLEVIKKNGISTVKEIV